MKLIRSICFYLLLIVSLSTMACTGQLFQNFGKIALNDETTRAFESYSVNEDFRYYISGPDGNPNVIVGLHRDHRIGPRILWKEVEMTPKAMKEITENMKKRASVRMHFLYGFNLLDPQGKPIGVWYSIQTARTCLQIRDDGTVRIDTPDLDTYQQMDGDTGMTLESG